MEQYIIIVKKNDFNISNNNLNLPVTKFAPFPMDFDTVRVSNCVSVKNRTGRHLFISPGPILARERDLVVTGN